MSNNITPVSFPVSQLHFDRENPRLVEYGVTAKTPESEILNILWEAMDVNELVQSIAASGFFQHEPLIVVKEKGNHVVIEGNRRLAAVKVLLNQKAPGKSNSSIPKISAAERDKLKQLPAIVSTRESTWRYLGFKHVNGAAKWSSYAKATYIAHVHREYEIPLSEIASQIGDGHRTVQRLYRGLMVIEQAEKDRVYSRDDRYRPRFAFSHLYTGLDYDGISKFINLKSEDEETDRPVPSKQRKELGELCVWLFGSKRDNLPPVVESQNPHLRQLDEVLKNRESLSSLRKHSNLAIALEASREASVVFEEALLGAKRELSRAQAHLSNGYDKSIELLTIAEKITVVADDIYSLMYAKVNPGKKKRARSE